MLETKIVIGCCLETQNPFSLWICCKWIAWWSTLCLWSWWWTTTWAHDMAEQVKDCKGNCSCNYLSTHCILKTHQQRNIQPGNIFFRSERCCQTNRIFTVHIHPLRWNSRSSWLPGWDCWVNRETRRLQLRIISVRAFNWKEVRSSSTNSHRCRCGSRREHKKTPCYKWDCETSNPGRRRSWCRATSTSSVTSCPHMQRTRSRDKAKYGRHYRRSKKHWENHPIIILPQIGQCIIQVGEIYGNTENPILIL